MKWLLALLALLSLAACGAPRPPTLAEQRALVDSRGDAARQGWWAYLDGDRAAAEAAFDRAPQDPLAALGRARLALDALDPATARREAAQAAATGTGRTALLGRLHARAAGAELGPAARGPRLDPAQRVALTDALHTVRVSFLPHLHRARLRDHPPREEDGKLRALGAWWALDEAPPNPDPDGLVITRWPLPPGPAHLELTAGGPLLAWRDGALVAATPDDRPPAGRLRFTAPGDGPLLVAWAARHRVRAWRWTAPAPPPPRPDAGPAVPDRAPAPDLVDLYLATEQALLDDDPAEAARLLARAPLSPAFAAQRAALAELDPTLPAGIARDRARAAWTEALPLAPARARVALARINRRAGEPDTARAEIEAALALAPAAWTAHRERVRVLLTLGWIEEAREAITAAEAVAPDPCLLLDDRLALGVRDPDDAIARLDACERPLDAITRLLDDRRPEPALDRLDRHEDPDAPRARRLRARALIALGRLEDARRLYADAEALPDLDDRVLAIDLERATDDAAEADLEQLLRGLIADHPTAREALTIVAAWPEWSAFAPLRLDTDAAIAAYEATVPLPGPAVRVLDHSALLYFADGTRLRWVHEIIAIRSREAAEVYGELTLPQDDVVPVALYTRKADGRRLFAVDEPQKDSLSLPDLEDGDYVVAIYLEPGDNGYLYDSGFLTPRVYFRGVDMPIFRQRTEIYSPDDTPPDHQRLLAAPAPVEATLGDRAGLRFDAASIPVMPPESEPVPPGLWLDSIRVGRRVVLRDDVEYYRDRVLALRQRTDAFTDWARAHAGTGDRLTRIARLTRAIRAEIDGDSGLIRRPVAEAPASGQGNRALVLSAALEAIGEPHTLHMARPKSHVPAGPFLQIADFPYPLIELAREEREFPSRATRDRLAGGSAEGEPAEPYLRYGEHGEAEQSRMRGGIAARSRDTHALLGQEDGTWIDPGPDRAAIGWIPHLMLGGDAIQIWPPAGPIGPKPLPTTRAVGDHRTVRVTARWHADGIIRGEVVDTLTGQEASVIGRYLDQLDPEQRPRLVERLLIQAFPTGKVTTFDDRDRPRDAPLVLRYTFEAQADDTLRLGAFPVQPGRRYAIEAERRIPLSIDLPTRQRVELHLESDRPIQLDARPGTLTEGAARYTLALDADDDALTLTAALDIPGGVVSPDAYPAFATWARAVDARERLTVSITPPSPRTTGTSSPARSGRGTAGHRRTGG